MIRINELARELEVPSRQIIELLPQFGVTEKKTHSSSVEEDVADTLRRRFGKQIPVRPEPAETREEPVSAPAASVAPSSAGTISPEPPRAAPTAPATSTPSSPSEAPSLQEKNLTQEAPAQAFKPSAPLRPPLSTGSG